jgi:hypothetical protein
MSRGEEKRKCNRIGEVAVSRPMASRRRRSQVSTSRPYAAPERSAAHGWRPFHNDEARSLKMLDQRLGEDARHDLSRVRTCFRPP